MEKPTFSIDEAIEWTFLYCRSRQDVLDIMLVIYGQLKRYSLAELHRFLDVVERKLRILEWEKWHRPGLFPIQFKRDDRILIQDLKSTYF